ncbi:hypothetical protein M2169_006126 [Streptomyces sp. MJP52]|nr:hypothetical protein [Streptomyces sp. MJP52]
MVGVAYLHEHEQIDFVIGEAMEVLQKEFQLLVGERLAISLVSHSPTLRLAWVAGAFVPR